MRDSRETQLRPEAINNLNFLAVQNERQPRNTATIRPEALNNHIRQPRNTATIQQEALNNLIILIH